MEIVFGHIGMSLGTRVLGQKLRLDIEAALTEGKKVKFNFEGVNLVSHSFADECFGKLLLNRKLEELQEVTTFVNANEIVKKIIAFTLKERLLSKEFA